MKLNRRPFMLAALAGACALFSAGTALAQDGPGFERGEVPPAHLVPVGIHIDIGWHGDRYWDGHRYWARDEWMRHHPHDPGPPHRFHDDHRPPPHY